MASNTTHVYFYQPTSDLILLSHTAGLALFVANTTNLTVPLNGPDVLAGKVNGSISTVASIDTAKFIHTGLYLDTAQIEYNMENVLSLIDLKCAVDSKESILEIADHLEGYVHHLRLTSPLACPLYMPSPDNGPSGGTVLLVIFLSLGLAYLIGGFLVLKYLRGAEGLERIPNIDFWRELPSLVRVCRPIYYKKAYLIGGFLVLKYLREAEGLERIPNIDFWRELPSLVRDGFQFLISCGQIRPDTYERI